jgi:hypothetical protein
MRIYQFTELDGTTTDWVELDLGNNQFTYMSKAIYDAHRTA